MISTPNLELAKKLIKSEPKPVIIKAQNDEFNRKILEYGKFDILLSPESGNRKDSLRQLDSGLNEIVARIATKNHIAIGIDLAELQPLNKVEKSQRLARIRQNIDICRTTKTSIKILNTKRKHEAFSLLIALGASTSQAKDAVS